MEDSTRTDPEVLAKRALLEYASQIINGGIIRPDNADAVSNAIAPHPAAKDEPLAYCADCQEWTPMRWLPKAEHGKKAEQWFRCEYCGGRKLTLKYLTLNEAMGITPLTTNR